MATFLLVFRHFPPSFLGYILPPLTISTQNSSLGPLIRPPGKRLIRPPPPTVAETNSFSIPWASVASAAVGLGDWEATEPHSAEVPAARVGLYTPEEGKRRLWFSPRAQAQENSQAVQRQCREALREPERRKARPPASGVPALPAPGCVRNGWRSRAAGRRGVKAPSRIAVLASRKLRRHQISLLH